LSYSCSMADTVHASLAPFIDRIKTIERVTESIYLKLGKLFPTIKAGVDQSAQLAEDAIRAVLFTHRGGASAELAKRRSEEFLEDAGLFFHKASLTESGFLSAIEASIENLSQLDDIIDRIRADSEEMEIVSLNAMTVALKSGAAGRAFSVITDELKRLSGRTIQHANDLSRSGSSLMEELAALQLALSELAAKQDAFFGAVRETLEHGFRELDEAVDDAARWLRLLASEAQRVRDPVSDIMQSVQVQDIIRQSLDHVLLSLGAASEDSFGADIDRGEEELFLGEITRLSAALLDDIHHQVAMSLSRLRGDFSGIQSIIAELDAKRADPPSSRAMCFDTIDFDGLSSAYLHAKTEASNRSARIATGVLNLAERFKSVNAILSRFRNIVTASRIETARNKALSIVSNTVAGMMDLTERLATDINAAGEVTRGFSKALTAGVSEYLSDAEDSRELLERELARLKGEFSRMENSRMRLCDAETGFVPFSDEFNAAIGRAQEEALRIEGLAQDLDYMRGELQERANASGAARHGLSADSIHNHRLKAIVDRFTIFNHKQAASQMTGLGEELDNVGAESGDVTLF
jgi:hypothetical protein